MTDPRAEIALANALVDTDDTIDDFLHVAQRRAQAIIEALDRHGYEIRRRR